ncbi:MAG: CDP-2,3-bis-(O-geranylgeranyl)-sn-glycerol synthase [Archaeoglobaceae archaeon]|nr:CDP-2,3-bis-(O-geranylgeranyl)-sn-glycerol synthase [Archaeoglobaceae archaeon]MCX8152096.1 CDP-2,3-bis-(O-geranylgeranyl)-sn-glycerol synthase [Archaeoglobaceae archaeon]MDW8013531.1 CDP-2,3-bis-(O-geranylgeranyl)-sn-glycerol synthase [Archaeoglobaceae archaeon]
MIELVLVTIWLLLPAYTPNNFAVVLGGGKPIDLGKNFLGKRIFGDGKTIRGFLAGIVGGVFVANLQICIEDLFGFEIFSSLKYFDFFVLTFLLAFGSMLGDLAGSFIKRRLSYEKGKPLPVLDQLMFLFVAILISSQFYAFWYLFDFEKIVVAFIVTPFLHIAVNVLAYKLKLKDVPW